MKHFFNMCVIAVLTCYLVIGCVCSEVTGTNKENESPDFIITEICSDCRGDGTGGWKGEEDCAEFIELYNNSGKALDLYDYCVIYNPFGRDDRYFEQAVIEITPLKSGNFLDGSTLMFSDEGHRLSDLSNMPRNPATCVIQPEEIVVLWFVTYEDLFADYNNGKGISINDFRSFWKVPADVQVIAVDANGSSEYGGNEKNFNINNSGVSTYGIALMSEPLNSSANKRGSIYQTDFINDTSLICWATVDYSDQVRQDIPTNTSFTFFSDVSGLAATDITYVGSDCYQFDKRRHILLSAGNAEVTCGTLTTLQKMMLGKALIPGERVGFTDNDGIYIPNPSKGIFLGFDINGTLFRPGTTFVSDTAGIYLINFVFDNDFTVYEHTVDSGIASPHPIKPVTTEETTPGEGKTECALTAESANSDDFDPGFTRNNEPNRNETNDDDDSGSGGNGTVLETVLIICIALCIAIATMLFIWGYQKRRDEE